MLLYFKETIKGSPALDPNEPTEFEHNYDGTIVWTVLNNKKTEFYDTEGRCFLEGGHHGLLIAIRPLDSDGELIKIQQSFEGKGRLEITIQQSGKLEVKSYNKDEKIDVSTDYSADGNIVYKTIGDTFASNPDNGQVIMTLLEDPKRLGERFANSDHRFADDGTPTKSEVW